MACVCGYTSEDRSNTRRHMRTCRHHIKRKYDELVEQHQETVARLRATEEILKDRDLALSRARRDLSNLRARKNTITNNNICIVNNIYPYSKEPTIVPDSVVQSLLHKPSESVPRFVQLKHFTGPLWARNIHLPNRRGNTVRVIERDASSGLHWVHRDRKTVLDELFERHVEELRDNYGADRVTKWREWYVSSGLATDCPRETAEWKDQLTKLDLLLINHQDASLSMLALE